MNWEEIKNVLSNIISSLETLLQSDESESENAVEQVEESLNAAKSLIEKMDGEEDKKPEDEEDKKPEDEEMMKSLKKALNPIVDQLTKKLAESEKKSNERLETIEKAFEELLAGFGLVGDKVEKEKAPKQIQKQIDVNDFVAALAQLLNKSDATDQKIERSSGGLRGAVQKALGGGN